MKVSLVFKLHPGPWGGGNQFLAALKDYLILTNQYSEDTRGADIVMFDSFNDFSLAIREKHINPSIPFVHRLNGPISGYRGNDVHVDHLIYALSRNLADAVIFQSDYSMRGNYALGMGHGISNTVIHNAARPVFSPSPSGVRNQKLTKIVACSWSSNMNKGFDIYKYLDANLDFSRYQFTFIGRTPVSFKNIVTIPPQSGDSIVRFFRQSDLFLAASRNDPCSNAVLEALATGLPVVAHNSGGMPEIVGTAGAYFEDKDDVISAINSVSENIDLYRNKIKSRSICDAAEDYLMFFQEVIDTVKTPKKLTYRGLAELGGLILYRKLKLGTGKIRHLWVGKR